MENQNKRHDLDIGSIFRTYGASYLNTHVLCADQHKAFRAISQCRTALLGGHISQCDHCGHSQIAYNSCRNRHCVKCQYTKQLKWVDKLQSSLPVCRYFHMVFTLPPALHKLCYINQRLCYDVMFKASWAAVHKVALNPRFLGARIGGVSVLHTWGQTLTYHPHIHMLLPAGGLSDDGMEWVNSHKKFFLPVKAVAGVFRGVCWQMLEQLVLNQAITLPKEVTMETLKKQLYAKNWHVYCKKSLSGPRSVVGYLGNYTHRVAISNKRLVQAKDGKVIFRWKDYRSRLQKKLMSLDATTFIRRFMRHILPTGFYKIRYYGLFAPANRSKKLSCLALLNQPIQVPLLQGLTAKQVIQLVSGKDPDTCPNCRKGRLIAKTILDPV